MTRRPRISHTSEMATGLKVGGDVEQALENVGVPSYVLDETGVVRWLNAAAEQLVGDVRGRHFTSVVVPEDSRRARELFAQKLLGTSPATDATGILVSTSGTRVPVEIGTSRSVRERVRDRSRCRLRGQSERRHVQRQSG
jgi:PAS domain S-box-containing protein